MILKSLSLDGVGPYGARQEITFAPPSASRPVTLIGGMNGAGKTTIMRALYHALYGAHAPGLLGWKGSYDRYLQEQHNAGAAGAEIELRIAVPGQGLGEELLIRRSWSVSGRKRMTHRLDVYVDDRYDEQLSEAWDDVVETFAPRSIARLFFFDGEKVETLADLDRASETLGSALGALLGLDLLDQLAVDLGAVQRRITSSTADAPGREQLDLAARETAEAQAQVDASEMQVAACAAAVTASETDRRSVEDAYRAAGGALHDERHDLEAQLAEAQREADAARTQAIALIASPEAPLMLVPDLLTDIEHDATASLRSEIGHQVGAALESRDRWLVSQLEELLDAPARDAIRNLLDAERATRTPDVEPHRSTVVGRREIEQLRYDELPSLAGEALRRLDDLLAAQERLEAAQRRLARLPSPEALRLLITARSEAADRVAAAVEEHAAANELLELRKRVRDRAQEREEQVGRKLAEASADRVKTERVLAHADRAKDTLRTLRQAATARHVGRLSSFATEALTTLLRKEGMVEQLTIDARDLTVRLEGKTRRLQPELLSAGERQLVALSLLWALARAASRPLPIVIDTPLGRLDSSHRQHVVERYLPNASHQVVVLSTDTEITGDLLDRIEPSVGASYALMFDQEHDTTRVIPGYFDAVTA